MRSLPTPTGAGGILVPFLYRTCIRMRLLPFALLAALLPGFASAQSGGTMTPIQRCEQNNQTCIRDCTGPNAQSCMANCAAARAHCIQNPSTATQPRR